MHPSDSRLAVATARKPDGARKAMLAALERRLSCLLAEQSRPGRGEMPRAHVPGLGQIDACFAVHGLPVAAVHEVWTDGISARAAAAGFAAALAGHLARAQRGPRAGGDLVWVYPRGQAYECGLPYGPGLMAFGHDPGRLILVEARSTIEALWAGEEALRAHSPAGVVVALDQAYERHAFMASRRLELAARAGGASAFLLCLGPDAPVSAASLRWRVWPAPGLEVGRMPSAIPEWGRAFPARLRWRVALERNRLGRTGTWTIEWNHETATLAPVDAGADADTRVRAGSGTDAGASAALLVGRAGTAAPRRRSDGIRRLSA